MKKILIILALFAASGTTSTQAQYRQTQTAWGTYDGSTNRDSRGEYRWEMRERRVWIPEYRTSGIFGIGSRRVPGHYEMRSERVKVYLKGNRNKKVHPHGMPPGQRKKSNYGYRERYESRDKRHGKGPERNAGRHRSERD